MANRFRTLRRSLAPRWLTDGEGGLVGWSLDILKDAFVERARQGLMARLPQNNPAGTKTAPADALIQLGKDRRVVRGIFESQTAYAARLLRWLDDRKTAGNAFSLLQKLAEYTGPGPAFRTVDVNGNWYSRAADGAQTKLLKQANWDWDGNIKAWSRFWVIIYPNGLWTQTSHLYDDAGQVWDENALWEVSAPLEQLQTLRAIVADWKPAGTRCVNIVLAFDNASFDPTAAVDSTGMPDGTWALGCKVVGGVLEPTRLTTAAFLEGT